MTPSHPRQKKRNIIEELGSLTERYLTSDAAGALSALVETEQLLRPLSHRSSFRFALAITLATRSEIMFHLGDDNTASQLLEQAVELSRQTSLGVRAGLITPEAVQRHVRVRHADSKVKWRNEDHA